MPKPKIPEVGTPVRVVWQDSGVFAQGSGQLPSELTIEPEEIWGRIVHNDGKWLVICQRGNADKPDPANDHYFSVLIACIEEINELSYD